MALKEKKKSQQSQALLRSSLATNCNHCTLNIVSSIMKSTEK